MDLEILKSGGANVRNLVTRVSMEVIADDCDGLYRGQPKCTEVVAQMAAIGYAPVGNVACTPRLKRIRQNSACEIEVLFIVDGAGVPDPAYYQYHNLMFNGCQSTFNRTDLTELISPGALRKSKKVIRANGQQFFSAYWVGASKHSFGSEYVCAEGSVA